MDLPLLLSVLSGASLGILRELGVETSSDLANIFASERETYLIFPLMLRLCERLPKHGRWRES